MIISDLAYLEPISTQLTLSGGNLLGITAVALAGGDTTYTMTNTDTTLKATPNGKVTIGRGKGTALAIGSDPYTQVSYTAAGFDKVIVSDRSRQGKYSALDSVRIIAIDRPNR